MKKTVLSFFLIIFILVFAFPVYGGLVPCGLSEDDPGQPGDQTVDCQLCHFFVLFDNIIDFLLFKIVPPLAALLIAIGGFMYIFAYVGGAGGGPKMISQAKGLFTTIVIGLLIIYGAWLIVNTFFMIIGVSDWTGLKEGWWNIPCP